MFLLLLLACPGEATVGCPDHPVADCALDAACVVIDANALAWREDVTCYDVGAREGVGCMAADIGCDDAITYAGPGDGTCFEFPDACVPGGWVACDPSPNDSAVCAPT